MRKPKFVIFKDKAGEWRFNLKAKNGKIIAVSEGYKTKRGAYTGVKSVLSSVYEMVATPGVYFTDFIVEEK